MNKVELFKNFNIGKEIDLAGTFAYNGLLILNTAPEVYMNDQIFLFLYNTAVSVERMQKCVLFMHKDYDVECFDEFAASLKTHGHYSLQEKITKITGKKLTSEQYAFLMLLQDFYNNGRYANYSIDSAYDCQEALQEFVKKTYGPTMVGYNEVSSRTYITEHAKERIGRTLGDLLNYYYQLICEKSRSLNLFTYELRTDSPAEKVFLNTFKKHSLQAVNVSEKNALAELIIYLLNATDSTGYLNFLHKIPPLSFDPFIVQDIMVDIMNRQIPQVLVDEVDSLYEDMSCQEIKDRKESLGILEERNIIFPEDEDIDDITE